MSLSRLPARTDEDIVYPDSDGQPMGETDYHIAALILLRQALQDHFASVPDVYVASDLFLYYQQGNPAACKAPDTMVVKGVPKHFRRSFKTWVENAVPRVVFEITSEKTGEEDLGEKRDVYALLGVKEYFLFDPEAAYLQPPLQGFRLKRKKYVPLAPAADGSLTSEELGLRLRTEGYMLRLIDAGTGETVLTQEERAEQAEQRAKKATQRATAEKRRAEQERLRIEALAAEVERLRAELEQRKGDKP